jgi:hypothetical protein
VVLLRMCQRLLRSFILASGSLSEGDAVRRKICQFVSLLTMLLLSPLTTAAATPIRLS